MDGLTIPNGMGWSPDNRYMYFIDSGERTVRRFDLKPENADLANETVIVRFQKKDETPDGMCVDTEGMLWIALYGRGCVARYDPVSGEQIGVVKVSAPNVTSCCFGGELMKTLYITTARDGLTDTQLRAYPDAGSLFSCEVIETGLSSEYFQRR